MAFADTYRNQIALLIRTLPSVAVEECFAMKGGTAINLFVRDLPRLGRYRPHLSPGAGPRDLAGCDR